METIANMLEKILDDIYQSGVWNSAPLFQTGIADGFQGSESRTDSEAFAALTATLYMSAESTTVRLSNRNLNRLLLKQMISSL